MWDKVSPPLQLRQKSSETFPKIDPSKAQQRRYPLRRRDVDQQMQLVFYSNYAGQLVLGGGQTNYWKTEVYPLASIKEFEIISTAWRKLMARLLKEGLLNQELKPNSSVPNINKTILFFYFSQRKTNHRSSSSFSASTNATIWCRPRPSSSSSILNY